MNGPRVDVALPARELSAGMIAASLAYGAAHGISGALDPADYLFWYVFDANRQSGETAAVEAYLESGVHAARLLRDILSEPRISEVTDRSSRPPTQGGQRLSVLEFAAGYGRVTRHFRSVLPNVDVAACDIHDKAVAFLRHIGCDAFQSSHAPADFDLGRAFDVIYAFSFFTHMPRSTLTAWLRALSRHLVEDGVLIFTAHGEVSQGLMGVATLEDDGFFFLPASEQADLEVTEYGNTVTAFEYVHAQLSKVELKLLQFKQAGAGHHDVYVAHRPKALVRYEDRRFSHLMAENQEVRETNRRLAAEHLEGMETNRRLAATVDALYRSTSWRITAPLRAISRAFGRP